MLRTRKCKECGQDIVKVVHLCSECRNSGNITKQEDGDISHYQTCTIFPVLLTISKSKSRADKKSLTNITHCSAYNPKGGPDGKSREHQETRYYRRI